MKRILVVRPDFNPPGGGRSVAAWTVQALRDDHHVDVLAAKPVNIAAINRHYGTTLRSTDIRSQAVAPLIGNLTRRFDLWQYIHLLRHAQRLRGNYDVMIGLQNEADFGGRGIQYIHYPRFHDPRINPNVPNAPNVPRVPRVSEPADGPSPRWYHRSPIFMRWYLRLAGIGSGFSMARMRENLTFANSDWTGRLVKAAHGIEPTTLYPPVADSFPRVPWEQRKMGFVCVGRIAPVKRLEMIVAILAAVRQRGHDVHLHIAGVPGNQNYFQLVQRLCAQHRPWVSLDLDLPRPALAQLIATHRYGIHGMARERFGIAVAEMVTAGCIVFVPNNGGQVEIIGDSAELRYDTPDEAVDKIDAVLREPARQDAFREILAARSARFSAAEFMRQMRAGVAQFT
ncbi:MAG: glycosyltransferase family 4 protein [Deltaproteobacteria bacterium]|nr:glycosyltransferase family 4 protein [Deltaproteobacteria bacterium]MBI3388000.1 glycosyltransferase family 4 protein [Deltaproteobacteria bacterium]